MGDGKKDKGKKKRKDRSHDSDSDANNTSAAPAPAPVLSSGPVLKPGERLPPGCPDLDADLKTAGEADALDAIMKKHKSTLKYVDDRGDADSASAAASPASPTKEKKGANTANGPPTFSQLAAKPFVLKKTAQRLLKEKEDAKAAKRMEAENKRNRDEFQKRMKKSRKGGGSGWGVRTTDDGGAGQLVTI